MNEKTTHIRVYKKDAELIKKIAAYYNKNVADVFEEIIYYYCVKKKEEREKAEKELEELKNKYSI
jgi:hypothetical protein